MPLPENIAHETRVAHGSGDAVDPYRDLVPPIHLASTYERARDGSYPGGRLYSRDQNPSYDPVEALLCRLESGSDALLFASGMAAASAVLQALRPGDRIVAPRFAYWAWRNWLREFATRWQLDVALYDNGDADDLAGKLAEAPTRLLWIETPANPTWEVTDIALAVARAHAAGALVVVDSTVATPVLSQPLLLGADIVLHSATKYLNGHSDVVAGALVCRENNSLWECIRRQRSAGGAVIGPFEAWLLLRGMRTLFLRVRTASANALGIAHFLVDHAAVAEVLYPGLPSHPGHDVAVRQMAGGFGGMLSVRLVAGEQAARVVAGRLRVFKQATSLGSVESLVEHRASVEGSGTLCPADLLRFSVGIEALDDLIADLRQALAAIAG
ncbi:MAG TPA: PLP-dependent aspartate aminotransferase family protein [Accumulibacter sp.]|jgi:cystathionine gamma-synthase|nr:PLP-dependent aspartate aminotransferase family protein [Accumulibacter sp.]HQC79125.1 PLP-dependent aspartate aminotransferase family protein [Accumulibacter sp.]